MIATVETYEVVALIMIPITGLIFVILSTYFMVSEIHDKICGKSQDDDEAEDEP